MREVEPSSNGSPAIFDLKGTLIGSLPFPEPKEITDKLRQLYPKLEILWFEPTDGLRHWDIPDGKPIYLQAPPHPTNILQKSGPKLPSS